MTKNEAIKKLKQHFEYLKHAWKPHPDYETMDAIGYAISALEKQIPKKPIENDTNSFDCPCCKYDLKTDAGNPFGDYFLRHCDNCGQMIDWSDEENDA